MPEDGGQRSSRKAVGRRGTAGVGGFSGGQVGAELAGHEAAATRAFHKQMEGFARRAKTDTGLEQLKGNFFEYIEAAKFNRNAARAGKQVRAHVMAAEGQPTAKVDIALREGPRTIAEVQAKTHKKPTKLAKEATKKDYDGMDVLVPKNKVGATNRKLAKKGETKTVVGELQGGGVTSGGTGSKELKFATENPKLYRIAVEARQVGREMAVTGAHAAAGAAVVGGAISACSNVRSYLAGETDVRTAIRNVATDSAKSGLHGGSTGALGAFVRQGASRSSRIGMQTLAKSNVASAVAAGAIEVGVTVYEFAKGEITAEEAADRIGETGAATASGIYVGAAAGAIFGPPGAVVGSIVGYMAMSWVYQSSLAIVRRASLAEEEASRLVALCTEATRAMDRQREQFERRLETWLTRRDGTFRACLENIDDALAHDDVDDAVEGLARLAGMTGKALRFKNFEDFDQFMTHSTDPLVI